MYVLVTHAHVCTSNTCTCMYLVTHAHVCTSNTCTCMHYMCVLHTCTTCHCVLYQVCYRSSLKVMLQYLQQAQSLLPSMATNSARLNEANWLLKVAWNLALQCNHYHKEMADFFVICYQLSSNLPSDVSVLRRQRSCQLIAAAAFVQVAKATDIQEEKVIKKSRKSCMCHILKVVSSFW